MFANLAYNLGLSTAQSVASGANRFVGSVGTSIGQGIQVNVFENASPAMQRLSIRFPNLVKTALRKTVARHRRLLKIKIASGNYKNSTKKELDNEAEYYITTKSKKDKMVKSRSSKHIHWHEKSFYGVKKSGHLYKTIRYQEVSDGSNTVGYRFGFTSSKKKQVGLDQPTIQQAYGARKFALIMARGGYWDKESNAMLDFITPEMRIMFLHMGLNVAVGQRLDYPEREPVQEYLDQNRHKMIADFFREFDLIVRKNADGKAMVS